MSKLSLFFHDDYDYKSRAIPAVIALVPYFVLSWVLIDKIPIQGWMAICSRLGALAVMSVAGLYLLASVSRALSVYFWEKRVFDDGYSFPTTRILLYSDMNLSKQYKRHLRKTIECQSHIKLPSKKSESEDNVSARRVIADAVKIVKLATRGCPLTRQAMIDYGMYRNLLGASGLGLFASIPLALWGKVLSGAWTYTVIGACLTLIYLVVLWSGDTIISWAGTRYAERMFEDYMNIKNNSGNNRISPRRHSNIRERCREGLTLVIRSM